MNLYPYTDFHELNDDWIIKHVKQNETNISAIQNTIVNLTFDFDSKADKATTYTKTEVNSLLNAKADISSLATVATSGNYNDLTNKPTIPAAQVNSDWDALSGVAQILNKPSLATVATSGSYNDLSDTPTIPAAQVNSDWDAISGVAQILNKPEVPLFKIITGNFATSDGFSSNYSYPTGFDINNCSILSINVTTGTKQYRSGTGVNNTSYYRTFAQMDTGGIKAYNNDPNNYGVGFKIILINKS